MSDRQKDNSQPASEIILYQTEDGRSRIEVRLENETVWLTINQMSELFQVDKSGISRHLKDIYETGELQREATVAKYATVQKEGVRTVSRDLEYYNLDAIISLGYRVNSIRGTQFRIWATQRLREYIVKGFTLDDERLKGRDRLADYFDELLARIREIRASEQRVYQRIREIFALASDYREGEQETQVFFAAMQNKLHFAATGMTAAEIVRRRADATQANALGLGGNAVRPLYRTTTVAGGAGRRKAVHRRSAIGRRNIGDSQEEAILQAQRRQEINHEPLLRTVGGPAMAASAGRSSAAWAGRTTSRRIERWGVLGTVRRTSRRRRRTIRRSITAALSGFAGTTMRAGASIS